MENSTRSEARPLRGARMGDPHTLPLQRSHEGPASKYEAQAEGPAAVVPRASAICRSRGGFTGCGFAPRIERNYPNRAH